MEYAVVEGYAAGEMVEHVNKLLNEGWELHGHLAVAGVVNADGTARYLYAQAMIKRRKEEWTTA